MADQTVLFTIVPRGVTLDRDDLPVSVIVSPRLRGDDRLGAFPDWLDWTARLQDEGLTLEICCAGHTRQFTVQPGDRRPDLWRGLFNEDTPVESHTFNDYSDRSILSYSMREALSGIKGLYQAASVELALPGRGDAQGREQGDNRRRLRDLTDGVAVHWNGHAAHDWRERMRIPPPRGTEPPPPPPPPRAALDGEGLLPDSRASLQDVALPFSVFYHMPTPPREDNPVKLDEDHVLDFHRVLSALSAYPPLLRALGLVVDLTLPRDFVALTDQRPFHTLSVVRVGRDWQVPTRTQELETAYVHRHVGRQRLFATASRTEQDPNAPIEILGLLNLDPDHFGLAQVDVDGALHKAIMLADTLHNPDPAGNLDPNVQPEAALHPEVFDPGATLPALRSGGLSLYADRRYVHLLDILHEAKTFNHALETGGAQPRPFFAEDLVRGYRLDIWDSRTNDWHSLHRRQGSYRVEGARFDTEAEEGFVQLALTQPTPDAPGDTKDLYLHEAIARWAGWSLSVPRPGLHLTKHPEAGQAVPDDDGDPEEDQPITPFKMTVEYRILPRTLPRLRYGTRYRVRARAVDLAGSGLEDLAQDQLVLERLSRVFALPRDPEGFVYLRAEPVAAPLVVARDPAAVTGPGSALDRLVIRTANVAGDADPTAPDPAVAADQIAADLTAADRHLMPPRASIEMGERLGMFDDAAGQLRPDAAMWQLIDERDRGEFQQQHLVVAGKENDYPVEPGEQIDPLPYLPDLSARGAALRDLPGTPLQNVGRVAPGGGAAAPVPYRPLDDANPRPGSATLVSFGAEDDWQARTGFRLALHEPSGARPEPAPQWDPAARVLTVYLPKGRQAVVPLSSYLALGDMKLMLVWQWLREYIEGLAVNNARRQDLAPGSTTDTIAHVLQRAVEGGHWMLNPPTLLTLVHAVQQPLGRPAFTALAVDHDPHTEGSLPLQTAAGRGRSDPTELAPITAWRRPGSTDAVLLGALRVHGASTARVDLLATWDDPVEDLADPPMNDTGTSLEHHEAHVDQLPLPRPEEGYLFAPGTDGRSVGYYDPEHDQIVFARQADRSALPGWDYVWFSDAAPRQQFHDAKHHIVSYTARAVSRYQEYFAPDAPGGFTRDSLPIRVDVPASARPLAPDPVYVLPTFGWERQTDTNLRRSVRFGGGLRVYLQRSWYSSGVGELLGVALWTGQQGALDPAARDKYKSFITQWGMDPIWQTGDLGGAPGIYNFPDAVASDYAVSLEERTAAHPDGTPGRVDVVGFPVEFDSERKLRYADLTVNTFTDTYMPFVRLALVRYQPHALADAKISRVVLADFAQITPDRSALITADPHHPRTLRVVVSGPAPRGPRVTTQEGLQRRPVSRPPTQIRVRVQERNPAIASDLTWHDVPGGTAQVTPVHDGTADKQPDLALWTGLVRFAQPPTADRFRLLIEEHEYIPGDTSPLTERMGAGPLGRLIYAETVELDDALISET